MDKVRGWFKSNKEENEQATTAAPKASPDLTPGNAPGPVEFRYGLGQPIFEDDDPQVDIIAIHGLNGDRVKTWTEGEIFWPRDLLPKTLEKHGTRAKMWSYGYNADSHSGEAVSVEDLWGHGGSFLAEVVSRRKRSNTEDRPIIFIVHSLGGLILKSALIMSNASTPTHFPRNKALALSTHGIIFCGVPHQGGNGVPEARILLNVGSVFTHTTTNIVRILEPGNEVLRNQRDSFAYIAGSFYTVALYETENTPVKVGTKLIVPKDSAVVPGSSGQKYWAPIGLNGKNHLSMVKFSSAQDPAYGILSDQLLLMLEEPFRDVNDNWAKWRREIKEKDYTGSRLRTTLPHAPSPRFCGRTSEMQMIEAFLKHDENDTQNVVTIYGAGGMGKTELVLQYIYQHQKDYVSMMWINAASRTSAETGFIEAMQTLILVEVKNAPGSKPDYAKIATELNVVGLIDLNGLLKIPEEDEGAVQRVVEGLKAWLARYVNGTWLLVFDNHDDMSFPLRDFFPSCSWGSIIVTSRRPDIKSYATMSHYYELEGLDEENAVKLLLSISGRNSSDEQVRTGAQRVVQTLHCLPLAIDQAAAFISLRPQITFDAYLSRYERKAKELLGKNEHPWPDYTKTCMTTWEISREAVREASRPAAALLQVCSFFNNDDIWGEFLRRSMCFEGKLLSEDVIDDLIAMLYSYSLIKPKMAADTFSIHAVVHIWARERLEPDNRMFTTVAAARMMKDATIFVHGQHASRGTQEYIFERRLLPHIEFLIKVNETMFGVPAMRKALQLANTTNAGFRDKVLTILDAVLSKSILTSTNDTAEEAKGSPLVGQRYFENLNVKDPELANRIIDVKELTSSSMIILANALDRQGRHRASARLELSLIYFMLAFFEPNDVTPVLAHISNLASQLRDIAKYQEAETLFRFTLREWPASHDSAARQIPRLKSSLAATLSRMGKYEEVALINSELSEQYSAELTKENAIDMNNCAVNLFRRENYTEAEALHRSVLSYREAKLGLEHPDTCLTLNGLANALEKQGQLAEAEAMHKTALQGRQAIFPDGHIAILRSMNNLAVTLKKRGHLVEAAKQYSEALDGYVRCQGEDHDETIRTRKNLAVVWALQKDFARAAPEMATCAKLLASTLGIEHPATLNAISDWANILIDLGRLKGASNLFWYILQVRLRVCVNDKALRSAFEGLSNIRKQYARRGKTDRVKELHQKVPKHEALLLAKFAPQTLSPSPTP